MERDFGIMRESFNKDIPSMLGHWKEFRLRSLDNVMQSYACFSCPEFCLSQKLFVLHIRATIQVFGWRGIF